MPRAPGSAITATGLTRYRRCRIVCRVTLDDTYTLQRAGRWDAALAATTSPRRRAEILTDRHVWRLDPTGDALDAIDAIRPTDPLLAVLLSSQIEYWRRLAELGTPG